ncbi:MAG: Gfo/Idh/MocA family oxidoreductase [Pseudomonadota bacterium]
MLLRSAMNPVHIAVVGAGSFGRHHVRHLCAHPLVGRVTIVDRDRERARDLAAEHGANTAESLEEVAPDGAVVAVPTEAHRTVAEPLLARGIAVLVEKPIAATPAEAESLLRTSIASGAPVQVGHIERFSPAFRALAKAAGPVRHVCCRRHNPPRPVAPAADVVLDLMIHDIDLALALCDAPVTRVAAMAPDGIGQEAAVARIVFANGAVADLSASRLSPVVERTLTVHDVAGVLHADLAAKTLHRTAKGTVSEITLSPGDNLAAELDDFLAAVSGRKSPDVDGAAGLAALRVADEVRTALSHHYKLSA